AIHPHRTGGWGISRKTLKPEKLRCLITKRVGLAPTIWAEKSPKPEILEACRSIYTWAIFPEARQIFQSL
ncbi:hypothetical protein, partial [Scytonema sp. HK-05]|uniref:hypothetical protein n=1 Tax=Scytonema sp. HK-05 TaxID=1137095 RepID=UPI00095A7351